uniref:Uncharacterized protein n=1 Tax=Caenorhabditis japonica TaxID=281687 RepID=A0A8R1DUF5_CAEJA
MLILRLISILSFLIIQAESSQLIRVRKFVERPATIRRSTADDDLDMAAAELVFKEKEALKPLTASERIEGPPAKQLPFGTEHAGEMTEPSVAAPAAEPTFSELKKTENAEHPATTQAELKSSMVGEGSFHETEAPTTTPVSRFSGGIHDGQTSSGRVVAEPMRKWQQPLQGHGRLIAYDFSVNPEYPQFAPRARGLVGIPDGWNLDKQIDEEFRSGFRHVDFRRRYR